MQQGAKPRRCRQRRLVALSHLLCLALACWPAATLAVAPADGGFRVDTSVAACHVDKAFLAAVRAQLTEPILRRFQEVLQETELSGGCGALQMIDARMASRQNGFSLGAAQLDLKQHPKEGWKLLDELESVCSAQVEDAALRLGTADSGVFTMDVLTRPTWELRQDPILWPALLALRPKVEALLRTKCGQSLMAPQYRIHVEWGLSRATITHSLIKKVAPELAKQDGFIWLYILDYGNVQGDLSNFEKALASGAFCGPSLCASHTTPAFSTSQPPIVTDLPRYALGYTCWGLVPEPTRRHDALRRLDRVLAVGPINMTAIAPADATWIKGELAGILAQAKADFPSAKFPALQNLVTAAGGAVPNPPTPTAAAELKRLQKVCAK